MSARTAIAQPVLADASVTAVTSGDTGPVNSGGDTTTTPSSPTTHATPRSIGSGASAGRNAPDDPSPNSKTSDERSSDSKRRWKQPRNAREFAAQANAVATMVLNGEMNLDAARTYSSVARTVAQALSSEVSRSRFLQAEPSLELPGEVFEE